MRLTLSRCVCLHLAATHGRHWHRWGHPDVVAVFNRVHLTGADIAVPNNALLQQLTFQAMHRLATMIRAMPSFLTTSIGSLQSEVLPCFPPTGRLDKNSDLLPEIEYVGPVGREPYGGLEVERSSGLTNPTLALESGGDQMPLPCRSAIGG